MSTPSSSSLSALDLFYRKFILTNMFTKGWGRPQDLKRICQLRRRMSHRETALGILTGEKHQINIIKEKTDGKMRVVDGQFQTPGLSLLGDIVPEKVKTCHFQLITNADESNGSHYQCSKRGPLVVQYAGTGDHYFWRRRNLMAKPMLKERGISSLLIENPFYGARKPPEQLRSSLRCVTDLFLMGSCLIKESVVLYQWAERNGFWPLVSHGISMGGHFACLGASFWPKPIGLVPCLTLPSAAATFTQGVMADAIPWDVLHEQYTQLEQQAPGDVSDWIRGERDAYRAGADFAQNLGEPTSSKSSPSVSDQRYMDLFSSLRVPFLASSSTKIQRRRRESISFMQGIMDECTHISNFPMPLDTDLAVVVAAGRDAYQPREFVTAIANVWPGTQIRYLEDEGHITSYLFRQGVFRDAIYDVIDKMVERYGEDGDAVKSSAEAVEMLGNMSIEVNSVKK